MEQVHRERLLKLATFLDELPPSRFDLSTWFGEGSDGRPDLTCNSTACALGWATAIPEFRELGLHGRVMASGVVAICMGEPDESRSPWGLCVQAAGQLFGLSEPDVDLLFTPYDGEDEDDVDESEDGHLSPLATPEMVAAHIRQFVAAS